MSPEIQQLQERIAHLEQLVNMMTRPDRYQFDKTVQFAGPKLGLFGVTPVIQPQTTGITAGHYIVGGTAINDQDTFDGYGTGQTKYTVQSVVRNLKDVGILKL